MPAVDRHWLIQQFAVAVFALVSAGLGLPHAHAVTIDWVTVGNPGNPGHTQTYAFGGELTFGSVGYAYRIMAFEWTNDQYANFLNAIDPDGVNPNQVYNAGMGTLELGGITFDAVGTAGSKYSVKPNMGNKPVNFMNWFKAARVANWLHNGAHSYLASDGSASAPQNQGSYPIGTATTGDAIPRNPDALYWIPTESEWYKAAYYSPILNDGQGGYTLYGNGFDDPPASVAASSDGDGIAVGLGNSANYNFDAEWNGQVGNVTTVGTNGAPSYYGAYDMSGNISELNDFDGTAGQYRGIRGGDHRSIGEGAVSSLNRSQNTASFGGDALVGFRLASPVPEPATLGIFSGGALFAGGWWVLKRARRAR